MSIIERLVGKKLVDDPIYGSSDERDESSVAGYDGKADLLGAPSAGMMDRPMNLEGEGLNVRVKDLPKYPNRPERYSDDEYEDLLKGSSPEAISYYSADYDPSANKGFLERIYKGSAAAPTEMDEKRVRNAKIAASVGDALGMLGQMWSASKGAHVEKRDYKDSALSQVSERERRLRELYLRGETQYNQGLYTARMKDFLVGKSDHEAGRKRIEDTLASRQNQENFNATERRKLSEFNADQGNRDREYGLKAKKLENDIKHTNGMEAQGWKRIEDTNRRTSAYVKNSGKGYQMIFEANLNDKDFKTDEFGNRVRVFEMSKGQIDQYARDALKDKGFMARHPELILQRPDSRGEGSYKYSPSSDVAAAYLKEVYERGYATTSPSVNFNYLLDKPAPLGIGGLEEDEFGGSIVF